MLHMHPLIMQKKPQIAQLCRRFEVARLELFGSAATGEYDDEHSDFDFLVDFALADQVKALDAYFGLKEELEALLERPVDLVMSSALVNPYVSAQVDREKRPVYEARSKGVSLACLQLR